MPVQRRETHQVRLSRRAICPQRQSLQPLALLQGGQPVQQRPELLRLLLHLGERGQHSSSLPRRQIPRGVWSATTRNWSEHHFCEFKSVERCTFTREPCSVYTVANGNGVQSTSVMRSSASASSPSLMSVTTRSYRPHSVAMFTAAGCARQQRCSCQPKPPPVTNAIVFAGGGGLPGWAHPGVGVDQHRQGAVAVAALSFRDGRSLLHPA